MSQRVKKTLVIVESPGKIKKIQSYLGPDYIVKASFGHVYDLNPKNISVDINNNFKPKYEITKDKRKVVSELKNIVKNCKDVILAADDDREGEAIAWCLAQVLKLKNPKRMIFHEITKTALQKSLNNIGKINDKLVKAQQARRVLDRIVGYKVSPILWSNIAPKLSAGRVQSVVTKLIVDRENEIKNKDCNIYYRFSGFFTTKNNETLKGTLYILKSVTKKCYKGEVCRIIDKDESKKLIKILSRSTYKIASVETKKSKRNPPPPFITSSLQQEAQRKYHFPVKKTMMLAQKLYEGGHITYMRTDAVNMSEDCLKACKEFIENEYGSKYFQRKIYKSKSKNAQEAHEAIRPTKIDNINAGTNPDEKKLYELIRKRTLASQMSPAEFENLIIQTEITHKKQIKYYFQFDNSKMIFDGFLKVYDIEMDNDSIGFNLKKIPELDDDLEWNRLEANVDSTRPPTRYTEATLVKKLEELGIGRPSTFAAMVSKIQERRYVEKGSVKGEQIEARQYYIEKTDNKKEKLSTNTSKVLIDNKKLSTNTSKVLIDNKKLSTKFTTKILTIGADKNKLLPTELGNTVTEYLQEHFCKLMDYKFTSDMEMNLDKIVDGGETYDNLLKVFYNPFIKIVNKLVEKGTSESKFDDGNCLGENNGRKIFALRLKTGPVVRTMIDNKWKYGSIKVPDTLKNITLEKAIELLSYPKLLGRYQDKPIMLNKGKFGYYLQYDDKNIGLEDDNIDLESASSIIKLKLKSDFATIKDGDKEWIIKEGKYGLYAMKKGNPPTFVSIPAGTDPSQVTLNMIKEQQVKKANRPKYTKTKVTKKRYTKKKNSN
jgi:DNA topoisomerase I